MKQKGNTELRLRIKEEEEEEEEEEGNASSAPRRLTTKTVLGLFREARNIHVYTHK